jgi:hypothetical protein
VCHTLFWRVTRNFRVRGRHPARSSISINFFNDNAVSKSGLLTARILGWQAEGVSSERA